MNNQLNDKIYDIIKNTNLRHQSIESAMNEIKTLGDIVTPGMLIIQLLKYSVENNDGDNNINSIFVSFKLRLVQFKPFICGVICSEQTQLELLKYLTDHMRDSTMSKFRRSVVQRLYEEDLVEDFVIKKWASQIRVSGSDYEMQFLYACEIFLEWLDESLDEE